ncbi:MAG: branched-chain amino acid ABC transporter permease [Actinomycetota bacterium]|nr:branched-chain amino acid ABC transporter permease [Acidimicrobiia bacterium]MDQ3146614.1 branched-chain amino acid ABC transporter permease [Actinomycetota bacterium]
MAVTAQEPGAAEPDVVTVEDERADRTFAPSPLGWVARGAVWVAIAYVVLVLPLSFEGFEVQQFSQAVIYGIIGLSLNVLLGYVGQISLGHQAFVGIGAFASAYMVSVQNQPFHVAVLVAMAVGAGQALVLGGVSLRIRGLYFALVTLAYGLVAEQNVFQIEELTGGGQGQPAPKPGGFESDWRYYYLCLAFLAVVLWIDWRMLKTKGGRALLALRENPRVAATFGINVRLLNLFAFVVSGAFAGLGGALLAHNDTFVSPEVWNFNLALVFVIMTVVGGLRSRVGVVIGSAFFALLGYFIDKFTFLEDLLANIPGTPDLTAELAPLVIGPLLLLLTLTTFPGGIGQQIRPIQGWLRGGRFDLSDRGPKEVQISDVRA